MGNMGARFLLNMGDDKLKAVLGRGSPLPYGGPGVLPPEKLGKYMFKIVHFRAN